MTSGERRALVSLVSSLAALSLAGLGSLACASSTAPLELAAVAPEIQSAEGDASRLVDDGLIAFILNPTDPTFTLASSEYLHATISSSAGDVEDVQVRPRICGNAEEGPILCSYFVVFTNEGKTFSDLAATFASLDARVAFVAPNGAFGRVYPFGDRRRSMASLRTRSSVRAVENIPVGSIGPAPRLNLQAVAKFSRGAVAQRDGVVSASSGDTIQLDYRSSTGALTRVTTVVPDSVP